MAAILVVEDEFGIADVLASALTDSGHNVLIAINGKQGLERLKESHPELVLLDFMMPVLDGPAMVRAMRTDAELRAIPIVIMSSLPESAISEAVSGMYDGFIPKPFRLRVVNERVNRVLNRAGY
jgi:DNA-binding response OmpR family regulator